VVTNVSCFGGNNGAINLTVSGNTAPYTYNWSPGGATTQDISNLSINTYSVTINDANACTTSTNATINNSIAPIPICLVTVDTVTSDKNMVVWEKPITTAIDSFVIYRNISSVMTRIGAQSYSVTSMFVDNTAGVSPKTQAHEYAISIIDSCGNESAMSPTHKTIHQVTPIYSGPPHTFDLVWSPYQGFPFADYEIWRDLNNVDIWTKIGTVPFNLTPQYTDANITSDSARYRIVATPAQPCYATIKDPDPLATTVKSSKSNSSEKLTNPVSTEEISLNTSVTISPNPSSGMFTVTNSKYIITGINIYNMLGEKMFSNYGNTRKFNIAIPDITKGVYQLEIITTSGVVNRKIVVSR
jgi:hypothetical protein